MMLRVPQALSLGAGARAMSAPRVAAFCSVPRPAFCSAAAPRSSPALSRSMHASASVWQHASVTDPTHETGLNYHPLKDGVWAVSLFTQAPPSPDHQSVIGHIKVDEGVSPPTFLRENPDQFRENKAFWELFHRILKEEVIANDDVLDTEAKTRENGWAHLTDARYGLGPVRTPAPDDIFGSVSFTERRLAPETYEQNKMYRFCIRNEGPMVIPDRWMPIIKKHLL